MFFSSKIENTAKNLGIEVIKVRNYQEIRERIGEKAIDLMIVDLVSKGIDVEKVLADLKNSPKQSRVFRIGYLPHVQWKIADQFREKGIDLVITRSKFSEKMSDIIKKHSTVA